MTTDLIALGIGPGADIPHLVTFGLDVGEATVDVKAVAPFPPPALQVDNLSTQFVEIISRRAANATTDTFGTVKRGASVAAATASSVSVDSADATDLASAITLANELKADVNQLVSDNNDLKTAINNLRTSLRNAGTIS